MKTCRNCNTKQLEMIEGGAFAMPFFVYRVWGLRMSLNWESKKLNILNMLTLGRMRQVKPHLLLDAGICKNCGFYSTFDEIPEKDLSKLYVDYRSNKYNNERESFEPGYIKNIAGLVGSESEAITRVKALNKYFKSIKDKHKIDIKKFNNAMDWGGANGRFLPEMGSDCKKFVFDISNIKPVKGVTKKQRINDKDKYKYIQVTHVLEHVSNPYNFLKKPIKHLQNDGYLYLEVPIEVLKPDTIINDALTKKIKLTVHEHINKYTTKSLIACARAHKLEIIDIQVEDVDLQWCISKVIRILAKKRLHN